MRRTRAWRGWLIAMWTVAWPATPAPALRLIGVYVAPQDIDGHNAFGGISGIDYDPHRQQWAMISDDRSEYAPARMYWAKLTYDDVKVTGLSDVRTVPLHREDGQLFAGAGQGSEFADGESLRVDPLTRQVVWSTEGDIRDGADPRLRRIDDEGLIRAHVPLPPFMHFHSDGKSGPRDNLTTEGMSFAPDGRSLWVSVEAPLIEDGPVATVAHGALTRILHLSRDGRLKAMYAYPLDPVVRQQPGLRSDNGISEIMLADARHLWVLERSGEEVAPKTFHYHCRLYEVDIHNARQVKSATFAGAVPLTKHLIVDFDQLGLDSVDNYEGMSFGSRLPDGQRSFVVVSDNNFSLTQKTQILVFAVRNPVFNGGHRLKKGGVPQSIGRIEGRKFRP